MSTKSGGSFVKAKRGKETKKAGTKPSKGIPKPIDPLAPKKDAKSGEQ